MPTELLAPKQPDTGKIEEDQHVLITRAKSIVIDSDETHDVAAEFLLDIKTHRRRIAEMFAEPVDLAHRTHKALTTRRNDCDGPAKRAESLIKDKIGDYQLKCRREQQAEDRRLAAEAREKEEEARLAEAEELEAQGQPEEAAAILEEPIVPAPIAAPKPLPKAAGISMREEWKHEVTNAAAVPRQFLTPNDNLLAAHAKEFKGTNPVPGVRFYPKPIVSARSRRP